MITNNEAYFLGLMYAKGDILTDGDKVQFRINIKYKTNYIYKVSPQKMPPNRLAERCTRYLLYVLV